MRYRCPSTAARRCSSQRSSRRRSPVPGSNSGGSLFLTRPTLRHYTATREELTWRAAEVYAAVASGALRIRIGGRYPLERAREAHEELQARRTTGKLLLLP